MMRILFILIFLSFNLITSQEKNSEVDSFNIFNDVNILDTPRFYRSYFSEYYMNENWLFRLEMQERSQNNLINSYTITEYPLLLKRNLTHKHSILFGPKVNALRVNGAIEDVSLFSTFGYQYHVTEDFSVEARVDYKIKKGGINFINLESNSNNLSDFVVYKVGAKLKF